MAHASETQAATATVRERELSALLARSERRLAEAQHAAHIGSWEWDVPTNVVTWTDELYRIYGIERRDFNHTYASFMERVHPDDRAHTRDVVLQALRSLEPFVYDHRVVRPDGSARMLHTRGAVITNAAGDKPERLIGCCWDITDRWEAQKKLEESMSRLRATLESTEDGILVLDLEARIVSYNARALALWGLTAEDAAQHDVNELVERVLPLLEDPDGFARREAALLADVAAVSFDTIRFKDGKVLERYSQPQRLGAAIVGRVCSFRDVTQRERLLRSALLLADASRLLAQLEVGPAVEAAARLALPLLGCACACDLVESGSAGALERIASVAAPGGEPFTAPLPRAVLAGSALLYKAGETPCLSVPLTCHGHVLGALSFAGKRPYHESDLELAQELADRIALALENARLHRTAREAVAARDEFLAVATHEIRGPAAAVHLAVQALRKEIADEPAARERLLETIERADRRLAGFVNELLDVTHIRDGKIAFQLESVDLGDVMREALGRLRGELARSGSPLSMQVNGPVVGMWDRGRLAQVASHLISNAIKFGEGKPILVAVDRLDGHARLVVSDRGSGIAPQRQAAIFEPFERAVPPRHFGGLGLGLFLARRIVEGLGGTIRVESAPGAGATFTVELPTERAA